MAEKTKPSESNSFVVRLAINNETGMLGKVTTKISECGGLIEHMDLSGFKGKKVLRDIEVRARNAKHAQQIIKALENMEIVTVEDVSDVTFLAHIGGKLEVKSKIPLKSRKNLSIAYTPGVARVCMAIANDKEKAYNLTIKKNMVAVISDGTAVLGLGDIGPEAAMPVMEGKACIFKEFAGVDAFPICLSTKDPKEIIEIIKKISAGFGAINLEDISAPRCFEIEEELRKVLPIPVFHDDQHGTAVVVLAAMINALKLVGKSFGQAKIVVNGAGSAGISITNFLLQKDPGDIIVCDTFGILRSGMSEGNDAQKKIAGKTNRERMAGSLKDALVGADVFVGVSAGGILSGEDLGRMNQNAIVFAMANPIPEIMPEEAGQYVRVMATGRSDYPNQINNALCFPGIFRGALDVRASTINEEMKLAAAHAIASCISDDELSEDYIIPSIFDKRVVAAVAKEVARAAQQSGVSRRVLKNWQEIHS